MTSRKGIFIWIPKTGGYAVQHVLNINMRNHHNAFKRRGEFAREVWDSSFKFCLIRNPWSLAVSWYTFHRDIVASMIYYEYDFNAWVLKGLPHHWDKDWCGSEFENDPLRQENYFQDPDGRDIVDYIGKYENFYNELKFISQETSSILRDDKKINVTNRGYDYTHYYNNETKELIGQRYSYIIDRFGYRFES